MNHPPCPKCSGLLATEWTHDWHVGQELLLIYCVNCGRRFDPTIGLNRITPPMPPDGRTLPRMVATPQVARV